MSKWKSNKIIPLETIERWLKDEDWRVRAVAMNACQGREVPLETIERWLKDEDCDVRAAAMNACQGREVPLETIERWLKDEDCDVRAAAYKMAKERGMNVRYRSFDPPALVYKKCEAGVIVVAKIPEDAEVRGKEIFEVTVPSIEFIFNNIMNKNTIYFLTREEAEKALD